ncbi:hypothetical protein SAY86_003057 [Trapa natans]|uniref:Hexosyltransferase n=1 Tax=Trapa natans TaxID=22666 RepID=A0AAN7LS98_TRANT|nr:hypothetical protein SAY86_003057 [Trapa natans]
MAPYTPKPIKHQRPIPNHSSSLSTLLLAFSIFSLLAGIFGISFSFYALRRPHPVPIFRCRGSRDALREFIAASGSRKLGGAGELVDHRPKRLIGFVGIQTGFGLNDRRDTLRSTWLASGPDGLLRLEQATGLAFRFVIGRSKDGKKMSTLKQEIEKYRDFMLIDVDEENSSPPYKTLIYLKAAFELFEADYYVKADDNIYLRPDRLATLLAKERPYSRSYIGCMKKGPVVTDPKMKWYEPSANLIGNEYFLHTYGPIYVLSAEIVASLAAARNDSLRMFKNEDVTIGSWMLSMNVRYEENKAMCDPQCTAASIAVWDIPKCSGLCNPVSKIHELHQTDICSKSPTLPPEDDE